MARINSNQEIINCYGSLSKEELNERNIQLSVRGRIIRKRLCFAVLRDQTNDIQLMVNKSFKIVKEGDIIQAKGTVYRTDRKELSVEVDNFIILAKCQRNLPDALYYGFKDTEERFRKRYLDFIINTKKKEIFFTRHKIIKNIRQFLGQREFIEIETPILVSAASGAQARPFITKHNKLHQDFYLRIATEIPLKKLLVGGFEKVYEIGRIFRNEGIDARHNPEFTTIEIYQAYENAEYMMNLTEELFSSLLQKIVKRNELE